MAKNIDKWLVLQVGLFLAILVVTPFTPIHLPLWINIIGSLLLLIGGSIIALAFSELGSNLTPFVKPKADGYLMTSGIYSFMRHPMYTGFFFSALGWSILWETGLGIIFSFVLFFILDKKASEEEKWLIQMYPEYREYKEKVNKFIPYL